MSKAVNKTFQHTNYTTSYITKNNYFKIRNSPANKARISVNKHKHSGVLQLNWSNFENVYIVQSGHSFESRYNEHLDSTYKQYHYS